MIKIRLQKVWQRINLIKHEQNVILVAVSKTRSVVELQQAVAAGQFHFGESYVKEALLKINALPDKNIIWHFIGPIQANKTAKIANNFSWVHSVGRIKIAKRLNEQRRTELGKLKILLQINIDNEPTKSGFSLNNINKNIEKITSFNNLSLRGFMCIPAIDNIEASFIKMAQLFASYKNFDILSMGMSNDLELAIKYGATCVRVGSYIFGKRI